MSGQCLCSWCVEFRLRERARIVLAAYDQARAWGMSPGGNTPGGEVADERGERQLLARRAERRAANAGARARAMREARAARIGTYASAYRAAALDRYARSQRRSEHCRQLAASLLWLERYEARERAGASCP